MTPLSLNALYASAQTTLFIVYAVLFFLDSGPPLFAARWARGFGLPLCAAGLALAAVAFVTLRSVIQIAPQPRENAHLVDAGVYGWLRHPIYTGIVLVVLGLFLRKPTAIVGVLTILVLILVTVKSTYEERLLAARYPEYPDYKRRTLGVIPFLT